MPFDRDFLGRLTVKPLTPEIADAATDFKCGERTVELFLKVACLWQDELAAVGTCWMDGNVLAGYMTTQMSELQIKDLNVQQREEVGLRDLQFAPPDEQAGRLKMYPALKIGMLGVCEKYHGKGLGSHMVGIAIGLADALSEKTACRFVIVEAALNDDAQKMYDRMKFQRLPGQKRERNIIMFYDLLKHRVPRPVEVEEIIIA